MNKIKQGLTVLPAKNFYPTIQSILADGKTVLELTSSQHVIFVVMNSSSENVNMVQITKNFPFEATSEEIVEVLMSQNRKVINSVNDLSQYFTEFIGVVMNDGSDSIVFKNTVDYSLIMNGGVFKTLKDFQKFLFNNFSMVAFSEVTESDLYKFNLELRAFKEAYPQLDLNSRDFLFENLKEEEIDFLDSLITEFVNINLKFKSEDIGFAQLNLLNESATAAQIKEVIYNEKELEPCMVILLHGWLTNDHKTIYEPKMRDAIYDEVVKNRSKNLVGKIVLSTYFNESKVIEPSELFELLPVGEIKKIIDGKQSMYLAESLQSDKLVIFKEGKTIKINKIA